MPLPKQIDDCLALLRRKPLRVRYVGNAAIPRRRNIVDIWAAPVLVTNP